MQQGSSTDISAQRASLLHGLGLAQGGHDGRIGTLLRAASRLIDAPTAAVVLFDGARAYTAAQIGLVPAASDQVAALAALAADAGGMVATDDYAAHPPSPGAPNEAWGFVAAVPVTVQSVVLGALCVIDRRPRTVTPRLIAELREAATWVEADLALRLEETPPSPPPSLSHSADLAVDLLLGAGDVLVRVDETERICEFRHGVDAIVPAEPAALVGRDPGEFADAEVLAAFRRQLRVARATGAPRSFQFGAFAGGSWRQFEGKVAATLDGGAVVHLRDVTDERARELASGRRDALADQTEQIASVGGFDIAFPSGAGMFSRQLCRMLDLPADFNGDFWQLLRFVVPDARTRAMEELEQAIDAGTLFDIEVPIETEAGRHLTMRLMGLPEYGDGGQCARISGALQDVTAARAAEAESQRRAALLDAIAQAQSEMLRTGEAGVPLRRLLAAAIRATASQIGFVGMIRHDADGRALHTPGWRVGDPTPAAMAHTPISDVRGFEVLRIDTLFGQSVLVPEPIFVNDVASDPRASGLPLGDSLITTFLAVPFLLGGEVAGMVALANRLSGYHPRLVTELEPLLQTCSSIVAALRADAAREAASAAARDAESRWRTLFELAVDGIVTIDATGAIESMNPAAERIFGFSNGNWRGHNVRSLLPEAMRVRHDSFLARLRDSGEPRVLGVVRELEGVRRDGQVFPLELSLSEFSHGGDARYAGVVRDVTQRKAAEAQMRDQAAKLDAVNQELTRAMRLKDNFLASMSHELRTPLNAILGLSEALQEEVYGPLTERQRKSLRTVEESGRHLLVLINDILDLSKIEADRVTLQRSLIDPDELANTSARLVREAAQRKGLTLTIDIDAAVGVIDGDLLRLKQILVNLLSNAVKFTEPGGQIVLDVRADADAEFVHLSVRDTGIGIAAEDQANLFQPFVQLDSTLARQHAGTGLGLALVDRLARLHGGSVALSSAPGEGTVVTVSLPYKLP